VIAPRPARRETAPLEELNGLLVLDGLAPEEDCGPVVGSGFPPGMLPEREASGVEPDMGPRQLSQFQQIKPLG
jgi:hypothetical protein